MTDPGGGRGPDGAVARALVALVPNRAALRASESSIAEAVHTIDLRVLSMSTVWRGRLGVGVRHGLPWTVEQRRELRLLTLAGLYGVGVEPGECVRHGVAGAPPKLIGRARALLRATPSATAALALVVAEPNPFLVAEALGGQCSMIV